MDIWSYESNGGRMILSCTRTIHPTDTQSPRQTHMFVAITDQKQFAIQRTIDSGTLEWIERERASWSSLIAQEHVEMPP
jgi:hypothetical protein